MNSECKIERKSCRYFLAITYFSAMVIGIGIALLPHRENGISTLVYLQMLGPGLGVIITNLIIYKKDILIPKTVYFTYIVLIMVLTVTFLLIYLFPDKITHENFYTLSYFGNLVFGVMILRERKNKKTKYGLIWRNTIPSWIFILIFVILLFVQTFCVHQLFNDGGFDLKAVFNLEMTFDIFFLIGCFFIGFVTYFGEEYGWRFFLQPKLQKRFGARIGVIIGGVLWGIWHVFLDFLYYDYGNANALIIICGRMITCISLGIFFGFAYMVTKNIWVPIIMHYLNNNLLFLLENGVETEYSWRTVFSLLLTNSILFCSVLGIRKIWKNNLKGSFDEEELF